MEDRCRWKDNSRMDLRDIGCESVYWILVAQDKDKIMNLGVHKREYPD